jgi:hypothetical protein
MANAKGKTEHAGGKNGGGGMWGKRAEVKHASNRRRRAESRREPAELLADPEAMADLRASLEDLRAGRTLSHEEVGRRLGL